MTDKKLSSGRKVIIRDLTIDQIDACKDIVQIVFVGDDARSVKNLASARTSWIRAGLAGGDFKNWNNPGADKICPDNVIKQLTEAEKEELAVLIQNSQVLGENEPSQSVSSTS